MINNLEDHDAPYLTLAELARYWRVSRHVLRKEIQAGRLRAIRLGPRLLRVSVSDALRFETQAKLSPASDEDRTARARRQSPRHPRRRGEEC